ncbi:Uncharacterised protein [Burkholderia pseudomallei]|nr:Uncharacterised protein [Burkholderia pseudomallei]
MSTEHDRYIVKCNSYGHERLWIEHSDDWGRGGRTFEGFEAVPPDQQAVHRKRAGAQDTIGIFIKGRDRPGAVVGLTGQPLL